MKITKKAINDRFILAIEFLVNNKYVQSKKQISEELELKGSKLSEILSSRMHATTEVLANFCVIYDIDMDWLLTGKGDMLKSIDSHTQTHQEDLGQIIKESQVSIYKLKTDYFGVERQSIPLYETSAAAGLSTIFSNQVQQVPLDHIVLPNAPKCDGAMFIRGDSMYPLLKSGDIACYKTINSFDNLVFGEKYILDICNEDDDYLTVKYIQRSEKGDKYLKLVSENKHHSDRDILISTIRAIAIVKATIRFETLS